MENNKVVLYETAKSGGYDASCLNNIALQRLPSDIKDAEANVRYGVKDAESEVRYAVKDAEADIRHDVLFEGQENQKTSLEVEARLKDRLTIDRNAYDLQFQNLGNKICEAEKTTMEVKTEVIKQGYETKLAIKDSEILNLKEFQHLSERLGDKLAHGFEEIEEKLDECCCENKLADATNAGLLSQLVKSLIK